MQYKFKGVVYKTQAMMKAAQRADAAKITGRPVATAAKQPRASKKRPAPYDVVDKEVSIKLTMASGETEFSSVVLIKGPNVPDVPRVALVEGGRLLSVVVNVRLDGASKFAWYHLVSDTCSKAVTIANLRAASAKQHSRTDVLDYDIKVVVPPALLEADGEVAKPLYFLAAGVGEEDEPVEVIVKTRWAVPKGAATVVHF